MTKLELPHGIQVGPWYSDFANGAEKCCLTVCFSSILSIPLLEREYFSSQEYSESLLRCKAKESALDLSRILLSYAKDLKDWASPSVEVIQEMVTYEG